ncbi:MAG: SDR family oxidoreductase [bacterium]|nr:SDR family oxidoreductase [bacterium]
MDLQLKGKRVIISGGTRGIGRAIAETFAGEGCNVAICARNAADIETTVAGLQAKGVSAYGAAVDILDGAAFKNWIVQAGEQMGGADILVSNVGAMAIGPGKDAWEKNLKLDVFGLVNLVEAGLPLLKQAAAENGDAAIVAIGSTAGTAATEPSAYGAIKGAIAHYIKGLAKQNILGRVRANVVSPGMVYFEGGIWHKIQQGSPEFYQTSLARNPSGRMATPQEVANAVVFLSSPCASYTTGINMIIDGALTDRVNY